MKGGALTLEVRVTLVEDERSQPPLLVEEEHPTPRERMSHRVKNGQPPPTPCSAGGADKSSKNVKKLSLNWHSKCLQAAGVEVRFPEEG